MKTRPKVETTPAADPLKRGEIPWVVVPMYWDRPRPSTNTEWELVGTFVRRPPRGKTLYEYMKERRKLPVSEAVAVAGQIAQAIDFMHARHVIHGDINPRSILIADRPALRLLDLEEPRPWEAERPHEPPLLFYTSPAPGDSSSQRSPASDVYSLGVVLYEMLGGHLLHEMKDRWAKFDASCADPAVPFDLAPVPPSLRPLLSATLAPNPEDRPTARDLVRALGALGLTRTAEHRVNMLGAATSGLALAAGAALLGVGLAGSIVGLTAALVMGAFGVAYGSRSPEAHHAN